MELSADRRRRARELERLSDDRRKRERELELAEMRAEAEVRERARYNQRRRR